MTRAARATAYGAAAVLLADVPGWFTRGDVLRGLAYPAWAALALVLSWPRRREGPTPWPAVLALGVVLLETPIESTWRALAAGGATVWVALAAGSSGAATSWRDDPAAPWRVLLGAGAAAAVWVLLDALVRRAAGVGPFGRPGIAGPVLAALLAVAVVVPDVGRRRVRVALVVLLAVACLVTRSRTGVLAGAFAALFAATLVARPGLARVLRVAVPALLAVAGVVLALAASGRTSLPGGTETAQVRFGLYRAALDLVGERPWRGHGLGSLPAEVLRVRDAEEARLSHGRRADQVHADVLHVAAEGGVPAALLLVALLVATAARAIVVRRRGATASQRGAASAALVVVAALALASFGEEVFLDPAPSLLLAVAIATTAPARYGGRWAGRVATALRVLLLGLTSILGYEQARLALADGAMRAYRDAIRGGVTPADAEAAAREHLLRGALRWRDDHPEALHRLGVHEAKFGRLGEARERFRAALSADPGRTDARLDLAQALELDGRTGDAREVLLEARRRDPTRFEVPMRLGHLSMGPEPVPGDPPDPAFDPIGPLRAYDEAAAIDPERFETFVAEARIARRRGDLAQETELLARAEELAGGAAEFHVEAFRWLEAKTLAAGGKDPARFRLAVDRLTAGLLTDPHLASEVRGEAERFLDEGERRETEIRAGAGASPVLPDLSAADRAFSAAALRLAALARVKAVPREAIRAQAVEDAKARRWRRSLARYRALLPWLDDDVDPTEAEDLADVAQVMLEAAKVAARTDGPLARLLFARGHALKAAALMAEKKDEEARTILAAAVREDDRNAEALYLLARVSARLGDAAAAEDWLRKAVDLEPHRAEAARAEPDLKGVPVPERAPR